MGRKVKAVLVAADSGVVYLSLRQAADLRNVCAYRSPSKQFDLYIPDEITDVFDLLNSVVRKFYAGKFFLDQYQQLQLIEGIKVQIVSEVHLICNSFGINT